MTAAADGSGPRVMFYVQHLMGIGHQRRMAAIARACEAEGLRITYVSGGMPVNGLDTGAARFVQLPPCRSPDLKFDSLVGASGEQVDDAWRRRRAAALLAAWHSAPHDALVVETYPFGRKLMRFELQPLLSAARADRALCVSSVRDIVDYRPKASKYEVMADAALAEFDRVLVHADPALVPFGASFPPLARIEHMLRYTGYVREHEGARAPSDPSAGRDEVIVSAGGGAYGVHLLRAAIDAASLCRLETPRWRVLVGQNVPRADYDALVARAAALTPLASGGIVVEAARNDFPDLLSRAAVSVSQGGYNTVMDVLSTGVRAVIVAYHDDTEREQLLRGRALAARGLVTLLPDAELSAPKLADAVVQASQMPPRELVLNTDGARCSARMLAAEVQAWRAS